MNDLISRQAAIDAILGMFLKIAYSEKNIAWSMALDKIRQLPSAQPEIIRCKDCKHRATITGANHVLEFPTNVCPCQREDDWYSWMPSDNWYCADAERRTDG